MFLQFLVPVLMNFNFELGGWDDHLGVNLEVSELVNHFRVLFFGEPSQVIVNAEVFQSCQELAHLLLGGTLEKHPVNECQNVQTQFRVIGVQTSQ